MAGKTTMSRKAARNAQDNVAANEVLDWISGVLNVNIKGDFHGTLSDGVLLCQLANAIQKGAVKNFSKAPKRPAQKGDNVAQFVKFVKGLKAKTSFSPSDLVEGKQLHSVVSCLKEVQTLAAALGVRPAKKAAAKKGGAAAAPAAAATPVINITAPVIPRAPASAFLVNFESLDEAAVRSRMAKVFDGLIAIHFAKGVERIQNGGKYIVGAGHGQATLKSRALKFAETLGFEIYSLQGGGGGNLIKATPSLRANLDKVMQLYKEARAIHLKLN